MGNFVWNEWARLVAITAAVYGTWASYWGIFYRKVFWDFVGGHLRAPGGLQPTTAIIPLSHIIVKIPLVQIVAFILCMMTLMLELPGPGFASLQTRVGWVPRIALLMVQGALTALFYQGTNCAIWSAIAAFAYMMAQMNGEEHPKAKEAAKGRGGGGAAAAA